MYEWGKVEKVLGNKTGITSYPWTVWVALSTAHSYTVCKSSNFVIFFENKGRRIKVTLPTLMTL